jgi:hypothetical protein
MSQAKYLRSTNNITLTHGAGVTTAGTAAASATTGTILNGNLQEVIITTPAAVDGAATVTANLIDQDGNTVWSSAALAVNTTTKTILTNDTRVPLSGEYQIALVFSAAQTTADRITKVVLLIDQGA